MICESVMYVHHRIQIPRRLNITAVLFSADNNKHFHTDYEDHVEQRQ